MSGRAWVNGLLLALVLWWVIFAALAGMDWLWHHVLIPWLAQP